MIPAIMIAKLFISDYESQITNDVVRTRKKQKPKYKKKKQNYDYDATRDKIDYSLHIFEQK